MKILDLYDKIYIIKVSKIKKRKVYLTRSKVKELKKIMTNDKIFECITRNIAVKIPKQLPKEVCDKLTIKYGLYVDKLSNSTIFLPFQL